MTGPGRRLRTAALVATALVVAAGGYGWAVGPRGVQELEGPTGVPDRWVAPDHPFDVTKRPIRAASMALRANDGTVVVAAADGRGYRSVPGLEPGDDLVQ